VREDVSKKSSRGGGLFLILFGVFWTLISGVIFVFSAKSLVDSLSARSWVETPCVIDRFEIVADQKADPKFRADLSFHYDFGGRHFTGDRLWREDKQGSKDYRDLGEPRVALMQGVEGPRASPAGAVTTCRVNPANPSEAALRLPALRSLTSVFALLFTALFLVIGIAILWAGARALKQEKTLSKPVSAKGANPNAKWVFAIFAVVGLLLSLGSLYKVSEWMRMRRWVETSATVIWSEVSEHQSDDSTTYAVDLFYSYSFAGREYRANRYDFLGGSSSGYEGKQRFTLAHPPGSTLKIYVDPRDPWSAVVQRDPGWWGLFGLFPLPFLLVGVIGMWSSSRKKDAAHGRFAPRRRHQTGFGARELILRPGEWIRFRSVQTGQIIAMAIFALFWNGMVWGVVIPLRVGPKNDAFFHLFMTPFVVIGVLVALAVIYLLIARNGPVYEVKLDRTELEPGGSTRIAWQRTGGRGQPQRLVLFLEGREEATYQNGSNNSTDTSVFHQTIVYETADPLAMQQGSAELMIPADAVPTVEGDSNAIRWLVFLRHDMNRWIKHRPCGRVTVVGSNLSPSSSVPIP